LANAIITAENGNLKLKQNQSVLERIGFFSYIKAIINIIYQVFTCKTTN